MKVGQLKNQVGLDIPASVRAVILYCPSCGGEYSANKGDYFMASDDKELKCCGKPLLAVSKGITFTQI